MKKILLLSMVGLFSIVNASDSNEEIIDNKTNEKKGEEKNIEGDVPQSSNEGKKEPEVKEEEKIERKNMFDISNFQEIENLKDGVEKVKVKTHFDYFKESDEKNLIVDGLNIVLGNDLKVGDKKDDIVREGTKIENSNIYALSEDTFEKGRFDTIGFIYGTFRHDMLKYEYKTEEEKDKDGNVLKDKDGNVIKKEIVTSKPTDMVKKWSNWIKEGGSMFVPLYKYYRECSNEDNVKKAIEMVSQEKESPFLRHVTNLEAAKNADDQSSVKDQIESVIDKLGFKSVSLIQNKNDKKIRHWLLKK